MQSRKHYIPALDFSKYCDGNYRAICNTLDKKPPKYVKNSDDLLLLRGRKFQGKWFIERTSAIDYMKSRKRYWESEYKDACAKRLGHDVWIREKIKMIDAVITLLEYREAKVIEEEQWKEQVKEEEQQWKEKQKKEGQR